MLSYLIFVYCVFIWSKKKLLTVSGYTQQIARLYS